MSKKSRGKKWKKSQKQTATQTEKLLEEMRAFRVRNMPTPRRRKQG